MVLLGTWVNVGLIIIGSLIGILLKKGIQERYANLIMSGLGLVTLVIGLSFALQSENMLIVIVSLVIGALIGEWIDIDKRLNQFGEWMKEKIGERTQKNIKAKGEGVEEVDTHSRIGEGFVTATLLFCVGSMAIMGALDSGLRGDHTILYTKSIMDGISALIFASSMGIGVTLSAVPILIYQGSIALLAQTVQPYLTASMMTEMNAVGGILLMGIGLSLLEV
ncbi:MAG: DUF554 domain-containing protein, partial [Niameybacter sp.]